MMIQTVRPATHLFSKYAMNDDIVDKEERKREYNRLAQREFRRRRKEHLKSLEQAQKEQTSEQSVEIERLKQQNAELLRENESLKAQLYGSQLSPQMIPGGSIASSSQPPHRSYSASPSIASTMDSLSGVESPSHSSSSEILPLNALSLTTSMMAPSIQAYADVLPMNPMTSHTYSMVHPSGARQHPQSPPQISRFSTPQSSISQTYQSVTSSPSVGMPGQIPQTQATSIRSTPLVMVPHDRSKIRASLLALFQPLFADPTVLSSPAKHLSTLQLLSQSLPLALKPTTSQLSTAHYYGVDLIASPALRDRLIEAGPDVSQSFCAELDADEGTPQQRQAQGQSQAQTSTQPNLLIWSDDPFDERSWEFSQAFLSRWSWLIGQEWIDRAEFWRRQRGLAAGGLEMAPVLGPEW